MTTTGKFNVTRSDFLDDAPKTNKARPLFARLIPWYYIILPTNKEEYLTFGTKSHIQLIHEGIITRELPTIPRLNQIGISSRSSPWINIEFTYDNNQPDVYGGREDVQARMAVLKPTKPIFTEGYKNGIQPRRTKTSFRVVYEIIKTLFDNYVLDREGIGYGLNDSDVFFRLTGMEYNKAIVSENFAYIWPEIRAGLIKNVKIFPATKNSGRTLLSRIVARNAQFSEDNYPPIRRMNTVDGVSNAYVLPPTTTTTYSSTIGPLPSGDEKKAYNSRR